MPGLNIYSQLCLCFSVADASSHPTIINRLTYGLERLSASFPWVAGNVVNESSGEGNTGTFKIKPLEKIPRLIVKDLRYDPSVPTMNALRRANFPFSMLDESILAPRITRPTEFASDSPAILLQANFITGGLLLTFSGQHNVMDMVGQGHIIHLISKACRNEEFTSEELSSGNLFRRDLIPFLDDSYKHGSELDHQIIKPAPSHPIFNCTDDHPAPPPPKCTPTYFTFDATSLAALKSLATKTTTLSSGFVSTDDALSAFIWQSVIRARLPRLPPSTKSTFARAVDTRRYLDIPQTYPGVVVSMTYHTRTLQELVDEPLGGIASQLRLAVDPQTSNLAYRSRALATFLNRSPDKSIVSFTASHDHSTDLVLSSWAKVNGYELDFDFGLGKPEAVRVPRFAPFESLVLFMPRSLNGEIAVAICLRDEEMERLKVDEDFTKYGRYVG